MPPPPTSPDLPPEPGVRLIDGGAEFCVYAGHATGVDICLFDTGADGTEVERRVPLRHRAHGFWFDTIAGVGLGQRYAVRVDGAWDPDAALLHNPAKLLLDPYARAIDGEVHLDGALYAHHVGADLRGDIAVRDDRDSAPHMPRCVIVDTEFDWGADDFPRRSLTQSLIYEVHVKSATRLHPGVPPELRGTYAGLAHPAFVDHLLGLGVTAVELLPVHTFTHEPDLVLRGLRNHWGYNTMGFFAPHAAYAAATDPQGVLDEFKGMVKDLHAAGIEVLLDVVYNHTAENSRDMMTLSWRGLDERAYYRLDGRGQDIDVTGCGNTLDLTHPVVARMVLDSLRYWVQECHVDGFRFDLAVALGRGKDDAYDRDHPFLIALRTDPVLSRTKLIAEPWDVGIHGWRTGPLPAPLLGVERPLPRHRAHVLAHRRAGVRPRRRAARHAGARDPARRVAGPLRQPRPRHHRLDQLRHRPRRLHARRPHGIRRQAQRRQRPRGHRRLQRQPLVEPRRRGPHRRPHDPRGATTLDAQPARHPAAVDRRADAQCRRRVRAQPAGQQQPLLPGQRDQLDVVGARAVAGTTCSRRPGTSCACGRSTRCCASARSSPAARCTRTARPTSRGSAPTASRWASAGARRRPRSCRRSTTAPGSVSARCCSSLNGVGARGRGHPAHGTGRDGIRAALGQ